jgi:hypothetical protein
MADMPVGREYKIFVPDGVSIDPLIGIAYKEGYELRGSNTYHPISGSDISSGELSRFLELHAPDSSPRYTKMKGYQGIFALLHSLPLDEQEGLLTAFFQDGVKDFPKPSWAVAHMLTKINNIDFLIRDQNGENRGLVIGNLAHNYLVNRLNVSRQGVGISIIHGDSFTAGLIADMEPDLEYEKQRKEAEEEIAAVAEKFGRSDEIELVSGIADDVVANKLSFNEYFQLPQEVRQLIRRDMREAAKWSVVSDRVGEGKSRYKPDFLIRLYELGFWPAGAKIQFGDRSFVIFALDKH